MLIKLKSISLFIILHYLIFYRVDSKVQLFIIADVETIVSVGWCNAVVLLYLREPEEILH